MSMGALNALILGEGLNFEGLKKELAYKLCSLVIEAVENRLGLQGLSYEDIIFVRAVFYARMYIIIISLTDEEVQRISKSTDNVGWKRRVVERVLVEVLQRLQHVKQK